MPFTPFHVGPGIAAHAVAKHRMSLAVFIGAQVAMDLQPGLAMLTGRGEVHGITHTLAGALVIGALCIPTKLVAERLLQRPISWPAAAYGAFAGTLTHIVFDGLVHSEVRPLWPLSQANPWFGLLSWHETELMCALLALPIVRYVPWAIRKVTRDALALDVRPELQEGEVHDADQEPRLELLKPPAPPFLLVRGTSGRPPSVP